MFNPAYQQLISTSRATNPFGGVAQTVPRSLPQVSLRGLGGSQTAPSQLLTPPKPTWGLVRQGGFGTQFKDAPPQFLEESKIDNKIERLNKPKPKKKKKKK